MRENLELWREYLKHYVAGSQSADAPDRLLALATRCIDTGHDRMAARCARLAGRLSGQPSVAHARLGHIYYDRSRYDEARSAFDDAIALDFSNNDAQRGLAMSYHNLHEFDQATYYYLVALSWNPDDIESRVNLGITYHATDRLDDAIEQFRLALQNMDQTAVKPWFEYFALGRALHDNAELEAAREALEEAVKLNPHHAESRYYLGRVESALGYLEEAVESFRTAVDLDPSDPYSHLELAELLGDDGDGKGAVEHGRRAFSAFAAGNSPQQEALALWAIGWGHYLEQEWEASAEASRAAIERDPKLVPVRFNLGLALLRGGRPEEARRVYEEAVAQPSLDIWDLEEHGINDIEEAIRDDSSLESASDILELLRAKQRGLADVR